MSGIYRIAIAGIGAVAEMHGLAIADLDEASLVAGSCRTESKGRTFGEEFDCEWYDDTESMLEAEEPDVLSVCTPSGAHLEPSLAAAERKIDVLCEKPLEITTEQIDRRRAAAAENDVSFGVIFPQRYNPVVQQLHEASSTGRFDSLSVINAYVPWWRDDEYYAPDRWQGTQALDGGSALMNQSIHGIDMIQWLAWAALSDSETNPVEEVFTYTTTRAHDSARLEVEDTAVAVLKYRNGALGQILGGTSMYPGSLKRIQLAGRGGTAEIREDELIIGGSPRNARRTKTFVRSSAKRPKQAVVPPTRCPSII